MHRLSVLAMFLPVMLVLAGSAAFAWEIAYEGDVVPNDPSLGSDGWMTKNVPSNYYYYSDTMAEGGALHLVDNRSDRTVLYYREGDYLPAGTDVTVEARVRVVSNTLPYPGAPAIYFGASVYGGQGAYLALSPDGISTRYDGSNYGQWYPIDLTQFHTFRIAIKATDMRFRVWADGIAVFDGVTPGGGAGGLYFGLADTLGSKADTYWDYVRYSKEYVAVPEPGGGLLVLAGGLAGMGASLLRRRRG